MIRFRISLFAAVCCWSLGPTAALAANYTFLVVDVTGDPDVRYDAPSLGEHAVAFFKRSGGTQSILVSELSTVNSGFLAGVAAPTLSTDNSGFLASVGRPAVSDHGDVAFVGSETGGARGVYVVARGGGTVGTIESSADPGTAYGDPSVASGSNALAFVAYRRTTGSTQSILVSDMVIDNSGFLAGVTAPTLSTDNSGFLASVGRPAINRHGDLAFAASTTGGAEVVSVDDFGVVPSTAVIDNSGFLAGAGPPAINDGGVTAIRGLLDDATEAIIRLQRDGSTELVIDNSGFLAGIGNPAINNSGRVAFIASLDAGGEALLTAASPAVRVIGVGDLLLGSRIVDLDFAQDGLSDGGDMAFWAALEDGRQGIFLAAEEAPEPATWLLALPMLIVVAGVTIRRRRRGKANA